MTALPKAREMRKAWQFPSETRNINAHSDILARNAPLWSKRKFVLSEWRRKLKRGNRWLAAATHNKARPFSNEAGDHRHPPLPQFSSSSRLSAGAGLRLDPIPGAA